MDNGVCSPSLEVSLTPILVKSMILFLKLETEQDVSTLELAEI